MNIQDVSLLPAVFVTKKDERFLPEKRLWQSAPSAAISPMGRIFCVYSADNVCADETTNNYNVCAYSDDSGKNFKLAFYSYHNHDVRISEALLFMSSDGVLYHFWTQSYKYFDGRGGIWCCKCENPDAEVPTFSNPKRICDGFMANNPTVLSDGRWLFPSSIWTFETEFHPYPEYEKASVWVSYDKGNNLSFLGGVEVPVPNYIENTVFERKDNSLVMLFRTNEELGGINMSQSFDGGKSWTTPIPFVLSGPSSRFMVTRFPTGTLLVVTHYNYQDRNNLTALISDDDGKTFTHSLLLDSRSSVSYPSGNVTKDGRIILAYDRERTGAREILLASFTEQDVRNGYFGENSYTQKIVSIGGKKGGV